MTQEQPTYSDLDKLSRRKQVMFALLCAEQVVHLVEEEHRLVCTEAIEVTKLWLEGKATEEQCRGAAYTIISIYTTDVTYAAWTADTAVHAAINAVCTIEAMDAAGITNNACIASNDKEKTIKEQWDYYDILLNLDKYAEELLNG